VLRLLSFIAALCMIASIVHGGALPGEHDPLLKRLLSITGVGLTVKSASCPLDSGTLNQLSALGVNTDNVLCWVGAAGNNVSPSTMLMRSYLGVPSISGQRAETISPSGAAVRAYLGTPVVSAGSVGSVSPTGYAMVASLGTPTISGIRNEAITPTGFAARSYLGTPTVSGSSVVDGTVTPTGFSMASALGTPTVAGGGGGGITYVGAGALTATSSSCGEETLYVPSGMNDGDIMIAVSSVAPSGFSSVSGANSLVVYKFKSGTQNNITISIPEDCSLCDCGYFGKVYAFRGVSQANPFDPATGNTNSTPASTSSTLTGQSITTVYDYSMVVALAQSANDKTASSAGGSVDTVVNGNGNKSIHMAYQSTPGTAGTKSAPTFTLSTTTLMNTFNFSTIGLRKN
jgi:hypothetical protein